MTKLTTSQLISLSEQELVDCDTSGMDQGCEGGLMDDAFTFIQQNHGLASEASYPYTGVDGTCNANKEASHMAEINGFEDVPANSEEALFKGVARNCISGELPRTQSASEWAPSLSLRASRVSGEIPSFSPHQTFLTADGEIPRPVLVTSRPPRSI
ncbi:hypothetical protein SLA2020_278480 [Shorea laevis]